ncbi:hypothetical protein PF010_g12811 [Phytophthora fragariae]|uniref:Uncharacterized protein n=1 Tax=Phytophthora fragariae TaxID=53985 RepID=A0A6G0NG86_9STRA|nr:hypothetical protein PF010_g12811 [Phytophthora fragariae]KAE9206979.1 hypothetical protein PF004_g17145 [Phytophthora fragariae]
MKPSGPRSEVSDHSGSSFESLATVAMDSVDEHPATYDSALEPSDAMGDDEDDDWEVRGTMTEAAEAAVVSAGRSSGVRPLSRSLVDELDDVAKPEPAFGEDDREDGTKDFPRTTEVTTLHIVHELPEPLHRPLTLVASTEERLDVAERKVRSDLKPRCVTPAIRCTQFPHLACPLTRLVPVIVVQH